MKLARLFRYTRQLEEQLVNQIERTCRIEEQHHAEFGALRADLTQANEARANAEGRAAILKEELERADRWIDKLSNQNFELTDRLLLKAGSVPTSEPLRSETPKSDDSKLGDLVDMSVRRTGPVAAAREKALAEQKEREAREFEQRRRVAVPAAVAAAANNEGVADVMQT